jgi:tetratricopeptide (TPR) repeat protein
MADEATAAAALKQRGSSLFQAADFAGAAAAFGSAAELEPGVAAHHSNCSLAWLKLAGNPAHDGSPPPPPQQQQHAVAALASAERCVALEPHWSKAHYRRGAALLRLGRGAEALAAFERAEQLLRLEEDEAAAAAAVPEGGGGAGERGGLPSPGGKGGGKQQRQRQELEGAMAAARAAVLSSPPPPPPPPPQPSRTTTTTGRRDGDEDGEDAEAAARDATAAAMARRRKQKDKKKRQRQRKQRKQQQQQQRPLAGELGGAEGQPYVGFPVGVVLDPGSRRRCVVARRDLIVGEVVWQAQAWASAVSDPFLRTTCAYCFGSLPAAAASQAPTTPPPEVVSCPRCEVPSYCDAECRAAVRQAFPSMMQSILTEIYLCHTYSCHEILRAETPGQAAPIHELECAALRQAVRMTAAAKQESTGVRLLVRMLAQRRLEQRQPSPPPQHGHIRRRRRQPEADQAGAEGAIPPPLWCRASYEGYVRALQAHLQDFPAERVASMRQIAAGLSKLWTATTAAAERPSSPVELRAQQEVLLHMIGAVQCNSAGIVDLEHHYRGAHRGETPNRHKPN